MLAECRTLGGCLPGQAKISAAYRLPARHVIHAVGPVWDGGHKDEAAVLASCYRNSLNLAAEYRLQSIAFPAISCGAYRFPPEQAARIAIAESFAHRAFSHSPKLIIHCCFDEKLRRIFAKALNEAAP